MVVIYEKVERECWGGSAGKWFSEDFYCFVEYSWGVFEEVNAFFNVFIYKKKSTV